MWKPTALVLGPGGIKGFLELGFVMYLEQNGLLADINRFIGVSIGAVISLLLVSGYEIYEIIQEASRSDYFRDLGTLNLMEIITKSGLIPHQQIQEDLGKLIVAKFGKILTLKELYQATGLHLQIITFKLHETTPHSVTLDYLSDPYLSCVEAVLLSSNIPFIFQKLFYKGDCCVDGALGDPYPIHLADDGATDVLGVYIESSFDTKGGFLAYGHQILYASMVQLRNISIARASSRCRHVALKLEQTHHNILDTTDQKKIEMVMQGHRQATEFFAKSSKDDSN